MRLRALVSRPRRAKAVVSNNDSRTPGVKFDANDTKREEGGDGVRRRRERAVPYAPDHDINDVNNVKKDAGDTLREDGAGAVRRRREKAKPYEPAEEDRPPTFSDESLALRFADNHADNLRYVAAWGRWKYFDGYCWQNDETLFSFDRARKICRQAAAECNKAKAATAIASARTVAAVIRLAQADRRIAAAVDQWDADPLVLNTPAGVLDLRDTQLREHRADDYLTKITGAAPDASCPTPRWLQFLEQVTGGDKALVDFLQRIAGYSLTGMTREHALFFFYGTGANGKTTFINAITAALGTYHRTAPIETFTAASGERHPTDLAGLHGARLVTAVETEEGRRWAESKIKALTGGDKIAARFMRQDFFEYVPQFKLVIAGNHKPGLRSVDEAIRRRFHLVPFSVTIPAAERDEALSEKLGAELPGILAWMVEGCAEWRSNGLMPPAAVTAATSAYLEAEDAIAAWLEECCERDLVAWERTGSLFASWTAWAEAAGEYVGSQRRFAERLEARGITAERKHKGRGFCGVRLLTDGGPDGA